ncbi:MAG: hypothetical protein HY470_00250 [Candidatus Ryanbacteria bacterium]|nr:hypothetical protein [Candidatus Ryanbacteria bacterium]
MQKLKRLLECLTVWNVPPTSLSGVEAILAQAASENKYGDPSSVNEFNALLVRSLYRQFGVPVIVQGELKQHLQGIPIAAASLRLREAPHYLSTRDIALWQKAACDRLGVRRVVFISYYPHYWRAVKALEKTGLTVLTPPGLAEIYDENNNMWWVRNKFVNRPYELLARLYFFLKGWI